ncbi:YjgP/YjgQ family permease [Nitritalea halalkaliphila LW7]|uniref:YjgP/YjgQ family permease n=1 Tax=Nitritalea halalkaliphila LW7 TaxID=1189621 RepID=I5BV28_9BACT|nr:LptF/LptG family permease [Nitritalea halalkaliphila]EIM73430.1 YjgP/YjgQ family permease [Nitritalea halalkaliphila LW7]
MKKLDKLILGSFIGPFILTFLVVDFILLTVNMLKYFDEIFGKGLEFTIYLELISYFMISISPMALPLAVLLSSLMTFGNLGEHFELTAIKGSGISLLRALRPIAVFVVILTFFAYLSNNYLVPKINLKTFSLLYDIRTKSPALDIKEGVFYSGIPGYNIKVNKKVDDVRLRDIIIYDHTEGQGNINVILADSGRMEPFEDERYLMMTLYQGVSYKEARAPRGIREKPVEFTRSRFTENEMIFNLESFQMNRTPDELWSTNRSIKTIEGLKEGLDSMALEMNKEVFFNFSASKSSFPYYGRNREFTPPEHVAAMKERADSISEVRREMRLAQRAARDSALQQVSVVVNPNADKSLAEVSDDLLQVPSSEVEAADSEAVTGADQARAASEGERQAPQSEAPTTIKAVQQQRNVASLQQQGSAPLSEAAAEGKRRVEAYSAELAKKRSEFTDEQRSRIDSIIEKGNYEARAATAAMNNARSLKNNFSTRLTKIDNFEREYRRFQIAIYQKYTTAFACIVMFLIGAPLGAIIKKGGLGMPVLLSMIFFILFYMLTITGEKWAKEGIVSPVFGTWFSNLALLPFGIFFLRQARKDARLFEADVYVSWFEKQKKRFKKVKAS